MEKAIVEMVKTYFVVGKFPKYLEVDDIKMSCVILFVDETHATIAVSDLKIRGIKAAVVRKKDGKWKILQQKKFLRILMVLLKEFTIY